MLKRKVRSYSAILLALSMLLSIAFTGTVVYAAADLAQFNFENGQLNGFYGGQGSPVLENDTSKAYAGLSSMKATFNGAGTFEVQLDNPGAAIVPGTTITFNVYVPSGVAASFQPFLLDANWGWASSWLDKSNIASDTWVKAEIKVPDSAVTPINRLGLQIIADGPGNVWIDSVSYSVPPQKQAEEIPLFDFENGAVQGFGGGQGSPVIENDATKAYAGTSSLKVTYNGTGTFEAQVDNPSPLITADGTISFYYYVPANTTVSFQPFTLDANNGWNATWVDKSSITKDAWIKATVKVPASAVTPVNRFGIQVISDSPGSVWFDKVTFKSDVVTNTDKAGLVAMIQKATDAYDGAVEGVELGQYPAGSKAVLQAAISTATGIYNMAGATQQEIDQAVSTLDGAIAAFKASMKSLVIPSGLTAQEVNGMIQLNWQATIDAVSYNVKRSISLDGPYATIASGLTNTSYTDTIATGINYYYAVTAASGNFETVNSSVVYTKILSKYQLKDLPLLKTTDNDGWAGGDSNCLEASSASVLPMDNDVKFNNLPSARMNVYTTGTWWCALIAGPSWNTYNLEQYYANGVLEFNIKGAEGGESFNLGFYDKDPTRNPVEGGITVPINNFITVSKNWQHVAIPVKDLVNSSFKLRSTTYLRLERNGSASKQIFKTWLNDIKVTSTDNEKNFPFIKVNQLGYTVKSEKYAQVSGFDGVLNATEATSFNVKNATTGVVVYTGTLKLVKDNDAAVSGERVFRAYFTSLATPGTYYISVASAGIQDSYKFKIGDDIYKSLITDSSRYFYYQRANMALTSQYAGIFARNDFTPSDFAAPLKSNLAGPKRDVSKGWYDAGDFGKYTGAGATAISDLLWAYETYPSRFTDNQFNIPESGNGTPDLLDEVKYELDWLLKMQDTDGGFFHRVYPQTKETAGNTRYIDDTKDGVTSLKPTSHTGDAVGVLAHAYLVYKNINPTYANTMLVAAQKGWTYLEQHPQVVPSMDGPYNDDQDKNDRLYAAGSLFRATGTAKYNDYFKANYQSFAIIFDTPENAHGVGGMEIPAFLSYMSSSSKDTTVANWFKTKFLNWRSAQMARSYKGSAWRNTLEDNDYYWGSNMPVLTTTMDMVIGSKLVGDYNNQVINVARANINYILGINPMTFSYVSGYGENSLKTPFSGIYNEDGIVETPKGYMAGGANMYDASWFSRFNAKCYNDINTEWTSNEHTIYWNSGLVFSAALLDGEIAALSGKLMSVRLDAIVKDPFLGTNVTLSILEPRLDDGKMADLNSAKIVYTSLDTALATVDATGVVKTLKKGNVNIKVDVTLGETTVTSTITLNIR